MHEINSYISNDKSSDFKSLLEKISKRFQYVCLRSLLFAKMLRSGVRNVSISHLVDKVTQIFAMKYTL